MKAIIRNILAAAAATLLVCACSDHEDVVFDTPFVSITDDTGTSSSMTITKDANNYLTTLNVRVCASNNWFSEPITVEYEMNVGDGLKEGVDFKVQQSTKSPLTFDKGVYNKPVRIIWMKNDAFDASKDCTLTIRLTGSNVEEMNFGYPGPDAKFSTFTFTKQ